MRGRSSPSSRQTASSLHPSTQAPQALHTSWPQSGPQCPADHQIHDLGLGTGIGAIRRHDPESLEHSQRLFDPIVQESPDISFFQQRFQFLGQPMIFHRSVGKPTGPKQWSSWNPLTTRSICLTKRFRQTFTWASRTVLERPRRASCSTRFRTRLHTKKGTRDHKSRPTDINLLVEPWGKRRYVEAVFAGRWSRRPERMAWMACGREDDRETARDPTQKIPSPLSHATC
ncbi:hypothetical protein SAMN02746041_01188 [Desulfacinum hydrothermale DSM 13146]|uniref:Uncharacterized protein n=1 Tax=Desulfacinum hydrothermale DSM 13146 TaxID=1121390 RepID=A0A1W1XCY2_9BACT|nr:hypothetical protein SAMN02746041_01188 [Desulfacinum hydrothermale DSM 13146]